MEDDPNYTSAIRQTPSASLAAVPPFRMKGVTCRCFPLKADIATLNSFIDRYLNMDVPPSIAHFRPALPYVYLMVLDYGEMSPEAIQVQNLGWVSQHEMFFQIPLERWSEVDGQFGFQNWATVSPFIYVDDPMSQRTGREVYGWPKILAELAPHIPGWVHDPRAQSRLWDMKAHVFPRTYAGEVQESRTLVEIDQAPRASFAAMPPDAMNPWGAFSVLAQMVNSSVALSMDALDMMAGLRVRGYQTNRTFSSLSKMTVEAGTNLSRLLPDIPWWPSPSRDNAIEGRVEKMSIEQITLKQFQDAENPIAACYQALVASDMAVDRLNGSGLLGDMALLRGDPSGGFTVRVHRYNSQPIVESLGLEVASVEEGSDGSHVSVLKPVVPFWTDVDLDYGQGRLICSRIPATPKHPDITWRNADGERVENPEAPKLDHIPFNTARAAATQTVAGPFHFPDVTVQVFPLLADPACLRTCVEDYVNRALEGTEFRFEVFGSYAYLMLTVIGDEAGTMWSESNNIGWWADKEVSFCVPVRWYKGDKLQSLALVTPFAFANSQRAALTDREVNGRPTVKAEIHCPPDVWAEKPSGPDSPRHFLRMETEIFPALNLGQRAEKLPLLEIGENDVARYDDAVGWRLVSEAWGAQIAHDLGRRTSLLDDMPDEHQRAKALALEILGCEQPLNWISVKEYRDTEEANEACYQAVVDTERRITRVYDVREIDKRLHVNLYRYPGQPIARTLGLKLKNVLSRDGFVIEQLQPIRPFWMRLSVCEQLGKVLCWRSGSELTVTHPAFRQGRKRGSKLYLRRGGYTRVAQEMAARGQGARWQRPREAAENTLRSLLLEEHERLRKLYPDDVEAISPISASVATDDLYQAIERAYRRVPKSQRRDVSRLSRKDAAAALERLPEIQNVVESILSDEWAHWGDPRWYRDRVPKPELCIRADTIGHGGEQRIWRRRHGLDEFEDWYYVDRESKRSDAG